jgi:hypothetical protein
MEEIDSEGSVTTSSTGSSASAVIEVRPKEGMTMGSSTGSTLSK